MVTEMRHVCMNDDNEKAYGWDEKLFFILSIYASRKGKLLSLATMNILTVVEATFNQAKISVAHQHFLINPEYRQKCFRNLIKSNRNQIVFTIFRLIWNETGVRLVPNQSENGKYNFISV